MLHQWTHLYCLLVFFHSTMFNSTIWLREMQVLLRQPYSRYKGFVVCTLFSTRTMCSRFSRFHVLRWTTWENWFVSRKWTKLSRWSQVAAAVFGTCHNCSTEDMKNTWRTLELNQNGINNDQRDQPQLRPLTSHKTLRKFSLHHPFNGTVHHQVSFNIGFGFRLCARKIHCRKVHRSFACQCRWEEKE